MAGVKKVMPYEFSVYLSVRAATQKPDRPFCYLDYLEKAHKKNLFKELLSSKLEAPIAI